MPRIYSQLKYKCCSLMEINISFTKENEQRRLYFFCGSFMFLFCPVFAMSLCASVYMCFVVTCCERADLLALVCGV